MTEAEIRLDERRRITLTLTILMLAEHADLLDKIEAAIDQLPELPLYSEPSCPQCGGVPCLRRPRHGDGFNL